MFQPGDVVVRREICLGEVWFGFPTICVVDSAELLALYIPTGTGFGFPAAGAFPVGRHPWFGRHTAWSGHGKLMLHRPGDAHAIDVFWTGPDRGFAGWYFNLQDPYRRTSFGIDTYDHELDIWWAAGDPTYTWKDEELFEERVRQGRYPGFDHEIRAEGQRLAAALDAGQQWWDPSWATWQPDPSWPAHPHSPAGLGHRPAHPALIARARWVALGWGEPGGSGACRGLTSGPRFQPTRSARPCTRKLRPWPARR